MTGTILGATSDPGQVVPQGAAAIRFLKGLGVHDPVIVYYHPIATLNPYQALLYGHTLDAGVAAIPLYDLAELQDVAALTKAGAHVVLHLHWTNKVLDTAETDEEARTRLAGLRGDARCVRGGRWPARLDGPQHPAPRGGAAGARGRAPAGDRRPGGRRPRDVR